MKQKIENAVLKLYVRMQTRQGLVIGNEKGQTATEYLLVLAVVVTAVVGAVSFFGDELKNNLFEPVLKKITDWLSSAGQ